MRTAGNWNRCGTVAHITSTLEAIYRARTRVWVRAPTTDMAALSVKWQEASPGR
jgi:hypothetical protein